MELLKQIFQKKKSITCASTIIPCINLKKLRLKYMSCLKINLYRESLRVFVKKFYLEVKILYINK